MTTVSMSRLDTMLPKDAEKRYRTLVTAVATEELTEEHFDVGQVLFWVGKDLATFKSDVAKLKARLAASATVAACNIEQKSVQERHKDVVTAEKDLSELKTRHQSELAAAETAYQSTVAAWRRAGDQNDSARRQALKLLWNTSDPTIDEKVRKLSQRRDSVQERLNELNRKAVRVASIRAAKTGRANDAVQRSLANTVPGPMPREEEIARTAKELADIEAEIQRLAQERTDPVAGMAW